MFIIPKFLRPSNFYLNKHEFESTKLIKVICFDGTLQISTGNSLFYITKPSFGSVICLLI